MPTIDLAHTSLRELNATLHRLKFDSNETHWRVLNPRGQHAVAVAIDAPILVEIEGHVGYYCAGMNQCATVVVHGNAAARCGISMKGIDIVVKGSVGHLSAFMAQAGCLVVLGDAGEALGDSIYEAHLYVGGTVKSLGADCVHKPLQDHHRAELARLLEAGGVKGEVDINRFRRYGSARRLYHFHIDNVGSY